MVIDKKRFWKNGYLVLKKCFSKKEASKLRREVFLSIEEDLKQGNKQVDALANPNLSHYVYDKRLLNIAKKLLNSERITYFGDASYSVEGENYKRGVHVGGWHRDNTDRTYHPDAPDWKSKYTLIRFGIYLQDHSKHSGGLLIKKYSHNNEVSKFKLISIIRQKYINTKLGDIGVWNMRITHAGLGRCFKFLSSFGICQYLYKKVPKFLIAPEPTEKRAALWISYGLDDAHLKRHCDYLLTRTERRAMWENAYYSEDTLAKCEAAGLDVINMPEKIRQRLKDDENAIFYDHHYQMPY